MNAIQRYLINKTQTNTAQHERPHADSTQKYDGTVLNIHSKPTQNQLKLQISIN